MRTIMSKAAIGAHLLIVIAVVAATTILGALHDIDGQVVAAILTGALALVGGSAIATASIGTVVNGKSVVPPEVLQQMQDALREAVDHLADSRKEVNTMQVADARKEGAAE